MNVLKNKIKKWVALQRVFVFGIIIISVLPGCKEEFSDTPFYEGILEGENISITQYVESHDEYSNFLDLLKAGDLYKTLTAYNPNGNNYTLFLPDNDAVDAFVNEEGYTDLNALLNDKDYVDILVRFHVLNAEVIRATFPFGAISDTTLSGDLLLSNYVSEGDSVAITINTDSRIIKSDIELTNGYIHTIDHVLKPITENSYEWLVNNEVDYSIFLAGLDMTGLSDTFEIQSTEGKIINPANTLLIESNQVFNEHGIYSLNDLINKYSPLDDNYESKSNGLYQFFAYHIIEKKYFLNDFYGTVNYNTYGDLPLMISAQDILKINPGSGVYDSIITSTDTTYIDYLEFNLNNSNINTLNGAMHNLNEVLTPFRPATTQLTFQFYEEPIISNAHQVAFNYVFDNEPPNVFSDAIQWAGVDEIKYYNSSTEISGVYGKDYIELEGNFEIVYNLPRIPPGRYKLRINVNDEYSGNATIKIYFDNKSIGGNIDLTQNPSEGAFAFYDLGIIDLINYENHSIKIESLLYGRFSWDNVQFVPVN